MNSVSSVNMQCGFGSKDDLQVEARNIVRREMRKDGASVPDTSKVFKKIDNFLNLGSTKDLDLKELTGEEQKQFVKMLTSLIKEGIVGYHVYEVDGKPEKHYIVNELGNRRLYDKKLWRK